MTIRFSTGLRNQLAQGQGFARIFHRGYIKVFSGAQPTTADLVETGSNLGIITLSAATLTKEVRATATLTVTGVSGTLTSVTVGTAPIVADPGLVSYLTSTTVTAALIADAINRTGIAQATSSGAVVTVTAPAGMGTQWNGLALAAAGITCTGSNFASGVASVNGLYFAQPSSGTISKDTPTWSMNGIGVGTAGWFRLYGSNDPEGASSTLPRMDGSCGVGSGDAQFTSLSVSVGSPHTLDVFTFTIPAA